MGAAVGTIRSATLTLLLAAGCLTPRSADVTSWAREGRVSRLTEVVDDRRAPPEVRAQAAAALFELHEDGRVEEALTALPASERSPVVAYLLHSFLPALLARDLDRGHAAMLVVRPLGSSDSIARADRLLLQAVVAALQQSDRSDARHALLLSRLEMLAPADPRLLLSLLEGPQPPAGAIMPLLAAHPHLLAAARAILVERVTNQDGVEESLGTLARWGPVEPVIAELSRGGQRALTAARALLLAAPNPTLAQLALTVTEDAKASPPLRAAMLAVLARMPPPGMRSRLLRLIRTGPDLGLRLQAFKTLTALEGTAGALPGLESFPQHIELSRAEMHRDLLPGLLGAGAEEARRFARQALRSRAPLARHAAILVLEEVGEPQDAARLAALARRRGPLGAEAANLARTLRKEPAEPALASQ